MKARNMEKQQGRCDVKQHNQPNYMVLLTKHEESISKVWILQDYGFNEQKRGFRQLMDVFATEADLQIPWRVCKRAAPTGSYHPSALAIQRVHGSAICIRRKGPVCWERDQTHRFLSVLQWLYYIHIYQQ